MNQVIANLLSQHLKTEDLDDIAKMILHVPQLKSELARLVQGMIDQARKANNIIA